MVKQFTLKLLVHLVIIFTVLEAISTIVLSSRNYFSKRIPWAWDKITEAHADNKINSDTLILGGSVGEQLFTFGKKDNYFTTSAVCLPATGYLLSNRIYNTNPNLKHIVFVCVPGGITGKFEHALTYNSFIRPFFTYSNFKYFDFYLIKKIAQKPPALLSLFNTIKILQISNFNYGEPTQVNHQIISDFSIHNLQRLKEFAFARGIQISFVAPPLQESKRSKQTYYKRISSTLNEKGFSNLFEGYVENIYYLSDTCYVDGLHFKRKYLKQNRDEIISMLTLIQ